MGMKGRVPSSKVNELRLRCLFTIARFCCFGNCSICQAAGMKQNELRNNLVHPKDKVKKTDKGQGVYKVPI